MTNTRTIAPNEDPVCGMTVDVNQARAKGLSLTHDGREFVFCGKGCFLEFRDDPETFLAPDYVPAM
jgi:YHS domain-containing protein